MKKTIKIEAEVKKVAFVDGNRAINENNVKKHVESLKEFGGNLVPMLYVEASEIKDHSLYDACTGSPITSEDYKDYIVILDGQHRYKAALALEGSADNNDFEINNLKWKKVNLQGKSFQDVLIEVNTRTQPWKGNDYINGCVLNDPTNEVAVFAKELTECGVSAKTINKYIFLNERFSWSAAMKDASLLNQADIKRAKEIWGVVKTFPKKMWKRSTVIDYILSAGGTNHWKEELDKIKALSDDDRNSFDKKKVSQLNEEFKKMMESQ